MTDKISPKNMYIILQYLLMLCYLIVTKSLESFISNDILLILHPILGGALVHILFYRTTIGKTIFSSEKSKTYFINYALPFLAVIFLVAVHDLMLDFRYDIYSLTNLESVKRVSDILLFFLGGVVVQYGYCIKFHMQSENPISKQYMHFDDIKLSFAKTPLLFFVIVFHLMPIPIVLHLLYPTDLAINMGFVFVLIWILSSGLFGLIKSASFPKFILLQIVFFIVGVAVLPSITVYFLCLPLLVIGAIFAFIPYPTSESMVVTAVPIIIYLTITVLPYCIVRWGTKKYNLKSK